MNDLEDFVEAGMEADKPTIKDDTKVISINPEDDERYKAIQSECRKIHADLLKMHEGGGLAENPALIGDLLGKLRLNCNLFFSFLNAYIDALTELQANYSIKRQSLYEQYLKMPKASPSGAETYAREKTRLDEANVKVVENRITQIKNEYSRYDGICIYLMARMKEFNTERIMN